MRTSTIFSLVLVAVFSLGCAPDSALSNDGGAGSGGNGGGGGGGAGGATVSYVEDVQPILAAKCAPCHTTQNVGHHNIGARYEDKDVTVMSLDAPEGCFFDSDIDGPTYKTMPKKIGDCLIPSIATGWMPSSMGCFNTPRPATCISAAEEQIIAAWVAAGMPR